MKSPLFARAARRLLGHSGQGCHGLLRGAASAQKPAGTILRDDEVVLKVFYSRQAYPVRLRRVEALVEVDGQERVMVFLTNNLAWAPSSVAELYRCRWQIECFFKSDQADPPAVRLSGQQPRKLSGLAVVDGAAVLRAAAFLGARESMGWQLYAAVGGVPFGVVAEAGFAGALEILWDSRWQFPLSGPARSALAAGLTPACCGIAT